MAYVTDTHPLLWYMSGDARLSKKAKSIFDETEAGPELHDRMIVATARFLNAELITKDVAITKSGDVKILW